MVTGPVTGDALRARARAVHTRAVLRWLRIEVAATVLLAVLDDGTPGEIRVARRYLEAALAGVPRAELSARAEAGASPSALAVPPEEVAR